MKELVAADILLLIVVIACPFNPILIIVSALIYWSFHLLDLYRIILLVVWAWLVLVLRLIVDQVLLFGIPQAHPLPEFKSY